MKIGPGLKRAAGTAMLLTALFNLTACSLFCSGRQTISVSSSPAGANVTINGERAGATPLTYNIDRKHEATLLVEKTGYTPATRVTSKGLRTVGIVDVIGGCIWLVPFFGLLSGGAWEEEPANIAVALTPVGQ